MLVEPIEPRLPLSLLVADPARQLLEPFDIERARSSLAVDPLLDQSAASQDAHVPRDRLMGQLEWFSKLTDGRLTPCKSAHDRPPGPVAEGSEGCVQIDIGASSHAPTIFATECLRKESLE